MNNMLIRDVAKTVRFLHHKGILFDLAMPNGLRVKQINAELFEIINGEGLIAWHYFHEVY